jgi:hypothetical protein
MYVCIRLLPFVSADSEGSLADSDSDDEFACIQSMKYEPSVQFFYYSSRLLLCLLLWLVIPMSLLLAPSGCMPF